MEISVITGQLQCDRTMSTNEGVKILPFLTISHQPMCGEVSANHYIKCNLPFSRWKTINGSSNFKKINTDEWSFRGPFTLETTWSIQLCGPKSFYKAEGICIACIVSRLNKQCCLHICLFPLPSLTKIHCWTHSSIMLLFTFLISGTQ